MDRRKPSPKIGFEEYEQRLKRKSAAISNAGIGILQSSKKPNDKVQSNMQSQKNMKAIFEHPKPSPPTRIDTKENEAFEDEFNKYFVQKPGKNI